MIHIKLKENIIFSLKEPILVFQEGDRHTRNPPKIVPIKTLILAIQMVLDGWKNAIGMECAIFVAYLTHIC